MGYEGKNGRGKDKNRTCDKLIGCSRQMITKQKMGENRCNDISFRPLSGCCQKRKDGVNEFEFFPKRGIYASFGKDSTNGEYKE